MSRNKGGTTTAVNSHGWIMGVLHKPRIGIILIVSQLHGGSPVLFACLIGHTYMSYAPGHIVVDQGQALMGNAWGRTPWPLTFLVENSHRCVFVCSVQSILQYCVWFSMFVQLLSVHIPCDACLLCVYICLVCLYNTQLHTHTHTHTHIHTHMTHTRQCSCECVIP